MIKFLKRYLGLDQPAFDDRCLLNANILRREFAWMLADEIKQTLIDVWPECNVSLKRISTGYHLVAIYRDIGADIEIPKDSLALSLDDFRERYLQPLVGAIRLTLQQPVPAQ